MTAPGQITGRFSLNTSGGTAESVTVAPGTTVGALIAVRLGDNFNEDDNTVRLNGTTPSLDTVLADGFKLSVTPNKLPNGWCTVDLSKMEDRLLSDGFSRNRGRGDHTNYTKAGCLPVVINPDPQFKGKVDAASLKSFKRSYGLSKQSDAMRVINGELIVQPPPKRELT